MQLRKEDFREAAFDLAFYACSTILLVVAAVFFVFFLLLVGAFGILKRITG